MADIDVDMMREKAQRVLELNKDPAAQARAKQILASLPPAPPKTTTLPLSDEQQAKIARETAAGQTEPEKPSIIGELGQSAKNLGRGALDLMGGIGSGFNENYGYGLPAKALDLLGLQTPEERQKQKAASPVGSFIGTAGGLTASALAGPEAALGRSASGLLGMLEEKVPALANSGLGRILGSTGVGAATGGGSEAARVVSQGGSLPEAAKAAKSGARAGAIIGGGLSTAGEGAQAGERLVEASKGVKARQLIEKYGGNVSPRTSGEGGAFNEELKGLPATDEGIGAISGRSAENVLNKSDVIHDTKLRAPYVGGKAAIDAGEAAHRPVDVEDVYQSLIKLEQSSKLSPAERSALRAYLKEFEEGPANRYFHPDLGVRTMTEQQLNDYKSMLQGKSRAGEPGERSVAQAMLGEVAHGLKQKVDQGPYAEINRRYSAGKEAESELRRGLGLKPKSSTNELAEINTVRNVLQRQGQNTVTAGGTTLGLDDIKQIYPELQRDIELPEVLRAKADLDFRLSAPHHGGLIDRVKAEGAAPAAAIAATEMMFPHHHGLAAGLGLGTHLLHTNAMPIAGRLMYGPAREAALGLGNGKLRMPGLIPMYGNLLGPQIDELYNQLMGR